MKIGILGTGNIGATIARRLSANGHDVKVANSRGPETIAPEVLAEGGQAVHANEVVRDVDVLIISVPLSRIPELAPLVADLPAAAVIIDTSNYYPLRDGNIEALDQGQVESVWVAEQLGRPVVKAWNAITSGSFDGKSAPDGSPGRIAIPVAADSESERALAMELVAETGFDAFDAGTIAESWRQQPGAPAYCTELTAEEMAEALAAAVAARSPRRRDLAMTVIAELMGGDHSTWRPEVLVQVNRLMYN